MPGRRKLERFQERFASGKRKFEAAIAAGEPPLRVVQRLLSEKAADCTEEEKQATLDRLRDVAASGAAASSAATSAAAGDGGEQQPGS